MWAINLFSLPDDKGSYSMPDLLCCNSAGSVFDGICTISMSSESEITFSVTTISCHFESCSELFTIFLESEIGSHLTDWVDVFLMAFVGVIKSSPSDDDESS